MVSVPSLLGVFFFFIIILTSLSSELRNQPDNHQTSYSILWSGIVHFYFSIKVM